MRLSAEQILLGMFNKMEYDGYGWWLAETGLGDGEKPPSFEEFLEKLEKVFGNDS